LPILAALFLLIIPAQADWVMWETIGCKSLERLKQFLGETPVVGKGNYEDVAAGGLAILKQELASGECVHFGAEEDFSGIYTVIDHVPGYQCVRVNGYSGAGCYWVSDIR
jgi:hypothetical protein